MEWENYFFKFNNKKLKIYSNLQALHQIQEDLAKREKHFPCRILIRLQHIKITLI